MNCTQIVNWFTKTKFACVISLTTFDLAALVKSYYDTKCMVNFNIEHIITNREWLFPNETSINYDVTFIEPQKKY